MTTPTIYELQETLDRLRTKVRRQVGVAVREVAPDWIYPQCHSPRCERGLCSPHLSEMGTWWTVDPTAFDCSMTPGPAYRPPRRYRFHCEAGLEAEQERAHAQPFVVTVGVEYVVRRAGVAA